MILASWFIYPSNATADVFGCVEGSPKYENGIITKYECANGSSLPVLDNPQSNSDGFKCVEGQDWSTNVSPDNSDVTVLSIHGGNIELGTSEISHKLSTLYGWNRYNFNGNIQNQDCIALKKTWDADCTSGDNFCVLHITSNRFNDNAAEDLVTLNPKAVAIHGCSGLCPPPASKPTQLDTICIGGKNNEQKSSFFNYVYKYRNVISSYPRLFQIPSNPLNDQDAAQCDPTRLAGNNNHNIVNRTALINGVNKGGLQLEITKNLRERLTNKLEEDNLLRDLIYGGVGSAMAEVPIPLVKLEEVQNLPSDPSSTQVNSLNVLRFANADFYLNSTLPQPLDTPAHPCGESFNSQRFVVEFNNGTQNVDSFATICQLDQKDNKYYINYVKSINQNTPTNSKNIAYVRVRDRQDDRVYSSSGISIP